jgi:hypothetical protein
MFDCVRKVVAKKWYNFQTADHERQFLGNEPAERAGLALPR